MKAALWRRDFACHSGASHIAEQTCWELCQTAVDVAHPDASIAACQTLQDERALILSRKADAVAISQAIAASDVKQQVEKSARGAAHSFDQAESETGALFKVVSVLVQSFTIPLKHLLAAKLLSPHWQARQVASRD